MTLKNLVTPLELKTLWDSEYYKSILTATASSCQFGRIREHQRNNTFKEIRANLNALIVGEYGIGKSTMLDIKNVPIVRANTVSVAGLAGTTTRSGEHVIGAAYKANNKLLIIDDVGSGENSYIDNSVKRCMNLLLEPPHTFSRMLGFKMNIPVKEKKGGAWVKGSENQFTLRSKFSCIVATTSVVIRNTDDKAWMSRFVPVKLHGSVDYMFEFLSGSNPFTITGLNRKVKLFEFPDYLEFLEFYEEHFRGSLWEKSIIEKEDEVGSIARNTGDLVRLAAFNCAVDDRINIEFEDAKKVFDRFYNQIWFNIQVGPLTHEQYRVLLLLNKKLTEDEIAETIQRSQPYVSKMIEKFESKGILVDRKVAKEVENFKQTSWEKLEPQQTLSESVKLDGSHE